MYYVLTALAAFFGGMVAARYVNFNKDAIINRLISWLEKSRSVA